MRVVAIVQARMGSSRLPGKVLADIAGDTMLGRVVGRLLEARTIDEVAIATTTHGSDDPILDEAKRLGVACWRGSETDVLSRYLGTARMMRADAVVRVTSDCPLLDAGVVDDVVEALVPGVDYTSNTHDRTYPRGLDVEALHRDTLERIARLGTSTAAREHVTAYLMEEPSLFRIAQVRDTIDASDLRWTVDTADDLALIRTIYALLDLGQHPLPYRDVLTAVRARPQLAQINAHVIQKSWEAPRGE